MPLRSALLLSLLLLSLSQLACGAPRQADSAKQRGSAAKPRAGGRRLLQPDIAAPEVISANVAHSASIDAESTIGLRTWPLPDGYRLIQRLVIRVIGRGVARKRAQMEAGWRTYIEEVVESGEGAEKGTARLLNCTEHPNASPDMADMESVDEELVFYAAPDADADAFLYRTTSFAGNSAAGLRARIRQRGLEVQFLQLYAGPRVDAAAAQQGQAAGQGGGQGRDPDVQAALSSVEAGGGDGSLAGISAACETRLLIGGEELLPATIGIQTALLLGLRAAAGVAGMPLTAANITQWQPASAQGMQSVDEQAEGTVEAQVWMQAPASGFQPSAFWQQVAPHLANATAEAGLRMRAYFLLAETTYTNAGGTVVGRANDPPLPGDRKSIFGPGYPQQRGGHGVAGSFVAIVAAVSAAVALLTCLIGVAIYMLLRRRQKRRRGAQQAAAPQPPAAQSSAKAALVNAPLVSLPSTASILTPLDDPLALALALEAKMSKDNGGSGSGSSTSSSTGDSNGGSGIGGGCSGCGAQPRSGDLRTVELASWRAGGSAPGLPPVWRDARTAALRPARSL